MKEQKQLGEFYKKGIGHGQANRISLKIWQSRIEDEGSVQRFLGSWSPRIVTREVETPRTPQIILQTVPISSLVGEVHLN